jgi:hypothetical protein
VFLEERILVPMPADDAQGRLLAHLRGDDDLQVASAGAFTDGRRVLMRAGTAGLTKQVQVQVLDPYERPDATVIPLRWIATGPAGGLFPQLDANIELSAVDQGHTQLALVGSYRPPFGEVGASLDRLLLNQAARATFRSMLRRLRAILLEPDPSVAAATAGPASVANPAEA